MAHLIKPVDHNDHIQGSLTAPFILVEYGDYQCPYCGKAYFVIKKLQEALKDQFCFAFRNFPLRESHPFALMAAKTAEAAAAQGKFWEMHDKIYENQKKLSSDSLLQFAQQLKLDLNQFKRDLQSPENENKIQADFNSGVRSGVSGIPCFFIHEERYAGDPSFDDLLDALKAKSLKK